MQDGWLYDFSPWITDCYIIEVNWKYHILTALLCFCRQNTQSKHQIEHENVNWTCNLFDNLRWNKWWASSQMTHETKRTFATKVNTKRSCSESELTVSANINHRFSLLFKTKHFWVVVNPTALLGHLRWIRGVLAHLISSSQIEIFMITLTKFVSLELHFQSSQNCPPNGQILHQNLHSKTGCLL